MYLTHIIQHINKKNGTYTLSLVNITYSDSGYYVCLPVNVPEDETNFFSRISVQIYGKFLKIAIEKIIIYTYSY